MIAPITDCRVGGHRNICAKYADSLLTKMDPRVYHFIQAKPRIMRIQAFDKNKKLLYNVPIDSAERRCEQLERKWTAVAYRYPDDGCIEIAAWPSFLAYLFRRPERTYKIILN